MNTGGIRRTTLVLLAILPIALSLGPTTTGVATLLFVGNVGGDSRGMTSLVGWIVGGALLGGAIGYAADIFVSLPLATTGLVGLGVALGGGLGAISHLLTTDDPATVETAPMTVDMGSQSTSEPRPADLFDEHPDPVLYVTDDGGGPVVRAANDAYEVAFDIPAGTIEDAPLGDVLVLVAEADELVESVRAGDRLDAVYDFETPDGVRQYRVRSVAGAADGYLLFTPVEE